jgi:phosphatidylglycerol lysyltransferase
MNAMQSSRSTPLLTRLVAYIVLAYGISIIVEALFHQIQARKIIHDHHLGLSSLDLLLIAVPQIVGLGFIYLGTLLVRRKYNAWLAAMALFGISFVLDAWRTVAAPTVDDSTRFSRLVLPILIVVLLWMTRKSFRVRSDMRTFQQALWVSVLVLGMAFLYGLGGYALLDDHDFHHEISMITAAHDVVDQLGLTTNHPVAHTRRARLFLDSLSVISVAAVGYTAVSFFEPIRMKFVNQPAQRALADQLLHEYPSDLDDFFKLWPHDKLYYFDDVNDSGLAYHVVRGVALVVGNPFGNPKHFKKLITNFMELCFVNDWLPAFVHVDDRHRKLYEGHSCRLQKIGEEAVLDLEAFEDTRGDKYFRQIRNRFTKLEYSVEMVQPPHSAETLARLREISQDWLGRPGRDERGFMLGYFDEGYLQQCPIALLYDNEHHIQGFMNMVPTYDAGTANYDLLRCASDAPGNANDFLVMGAIEALRSQEAKVLNLGLCPLSGVDEPNSEETTIVDQALRFVYANGDRFYSFSGLRRFKSKYQPTWEPRYIAYPGGVRNFTRILTALNKAMKVKIKK